MQTPYNVEGAAHLHMMQLLLHAVLRGLVLQQQRLQLYSMRLLRLQQAASESCRNILQHNKNVSNTTSGTFGCLNNTTQCTFSDRRASSVSAFCADKAFCSSSTCAFSSCEEASDSFNL
jgi:hypothetical protein